jgi:hypothetical protein
MFIVLCHFSVVYSAVDIQVHHAVAVGAPQQWECDLYILLLMNKCCVRRKKGCLVWPNGHILFRGPNVGPIPADDTMFFLHLHALLVKSIEWWRGEYVYKYINHTLQLSSQGKLFKYRPPCVALGV